MLKPHNLSPDLVAAPAVVQQPPNRDEPIDAKIQRLITEGYITDIWPQKIMQLLQ
jgi:hypothetical protein